MTILHVYKIKSKKIKKIKTREFTLKLVMTNIINHSLFEFFNGWGR